MRKSYVLASLLSVVAGAAGVKAFPELRGSDTMYPLTNAKLSEAGISATDINYVGGGSGTAAAAMKAGTQKVGPMSRFFNSSEVCGSGSETVAEGMAVAIDGISIVGSRDYMDTPQGAGVVGSTTGGRDCDPTTEPNVGLGYNKTITWKNISSAGAEVNCASAADCNAAGSTAATCNGDGTCSYTLNGWKDVLRLVYAGFDNLAGNAKAKRDCNSPVRKALVNNWGRMFQDESKVPAGAYTGLIRNAKCAPNGADRNNPARCALNALKHAFRRDDASGTSDTFVSVLGLPSIANSVADTAAIRAQYTPFCNALSGATPADTWPAGSCLPTHDAQDLDPIRRTCDGDGKPQDSGANYSANPVTAARPANIAAAAADPTDPTSQTEQVCGRLGHLGLVLAIVPDQGHEPSTTTPTETHVSYPTDVCAATFGRAPKERCWDADANSWTRNKGRCPNGDIPVYSGQCIVPVTTARTGVAANQANCLAQQSTKPSSKYTTETQVDGVPVPSSDGRVYNKDVRTSSGTHVTDTLHPLSATIKSREINFAYYRLHSTATLKPATTPAVKGFCQYYDASQQIGCLVQASPGSIGYAGSPASEKLPFAEMVKYWTIDSMWAPNQDAAGAALANDNTAVELQLAAIPGSGQDSGGTKCVALTGTSRYPLSRYLYLNALTGFETVTGPELTLFNWWKTAANASANAIRLGFTPIPGGPCCVDFNETVCGAASNVDACTATADGLPTCSWAPPPIVCVGPCDKPAICTARPQIGDTVILRQQLVPPLQGECTAEVTAENPTDSTCVGRSNNVANCKACANVKVEPSPQGGDEVGFTYDLTYVHKSGGQAGPARLRFR